MEIEKKKEELNLIKIKAATIKSKLEAIKRLGSAKIQDRTGQDLRIGDCIQIANDFTKFSEKNWAYKIRTKSRTRRSPKHIEGYHKDKFDTI